MRYTWGTALLMGVACAPPVWAQPEFPDIDRLSEIGGGSYTELQKDAYRKDGVLTFSADGKATCQLRATAREGRPGVRCWGDMLSGPPDAKSVSATDTEAGSFSSIDGPAGVSQGPIWAGSRFTETAPDGTEVSCGLTPKPENTNWTEAIACRVRGGKAEHGFVLSDKGSWTF